MSQNASSATKVPGTGAQPAGGDPRGRVARAIGAAWRELRGRAPASVVSVPAPAAAAPKLTRRVIARASYQSAEVSRLRADWRVGNMAADQDIWGSLAITRARARDLARNNPYVERYLNLLVCNVLGPKSIGLKPTVRNAAGVLDKELNSYIAQKFNEWASGPVTTDGRLSLPEFEAMQLETTAVDGEAFTRRAFGSQFRFGLGLLPVDADLVAERFSRRSAGDANEIRMGVEIDQLGRRVAYHIWDWPEYVPGSQFRGLQRLSASEIMHHYRSRRANQTRGISWLSRVMVDIQDLAGYDEAVIMGARAGANQTLLLQWKDPSMAMPPEGEEGSERQPMHLDLEPATATELDPGLEAVPFNPNQPTTVYGDFHKAFGRRVSSGLNTGYGAMWNDRSQTTYSSGKMERQSEQDNYQMLQAWWIASFRELLYPMWLEAAVLSGALELPGPDWRQYTSHQWRPRGWPWIEPQREAGAAKDEIAMVINSRQRILEEQGIDFFDILEEQAAERKAAMEAGVPLDQPTITRETLAPVADPNAENDAAAAPKGGTATAAE